MSKRQKYDDAGVVLLPHGTSVYDVYGPPSTSDTESLLCGHPRSALVYLNNGYGIQLPISKLKRKLIQRVKVIRAGYSASIRKYEEAIKRVSSDGRLYEWLDGTRNKISQLTGTQIVALVDAVHNASIQMYGRGVNDVDILQIDMILKHVPKEIFIMRDQELERANKAYAEAVAKEVMMNIKNMGNRTHQCQDLLVDEMAPVLRLKIKDEIWKVICEVLVALSSMDEVKFSPPSEMIDIFRDVVVAKAGQGVWNESVTEARRKKYRRNHGYLRSAGYINSECKTMGTTERLSCPVTLGNLVTPCAYALCCNRPFDMSCIGTRGVCPVCKNTNPGELFVDSFLECAAHAAKDMFGVHHPVFLQCVLYNGQKLPLHNLEDSSPWKCVAVVPKPCDTSEPADLSGEQVKVAWRVFIPSVRNADVIID